MPRRLLLRCQPDSVREFRAAARERYDDGLVADAGGRRLAAIYLWGYAAEMTLKAAYFALIGFPDEREIAMADIHRAIERGRSFNVEWERAGAGHNIRAWAELLVAVRTRSENPAAAYDPAFGDQVQENGQQLSLLWRETLRYHKNQPYEHEVVRVRRAVGWFLANATAL